MPDNYLSAEIKKLSVQIGEASLPIPLKDKVEEMLSRLRRLNPKDYSIEYEQITHYIKWVTNLPWNKSTHDIIDLKKAQVTIEDRKNNQPLTLPIPEKTLKAIVAYTVGGRCKSNDRHLILSFHAPYGPIVPGLVGRYIQEAMHTAGLTSTPYWLRHSYAQHLLSSGASIYEIKQMLKSPFIRNSIANISSQKPIMGEECKVNKDFKMADQEKYLIKLNHWNKFNAQTHGISGHIGLRHNFSKNSNSDCGESKGPDTCQNRIGQQSKQDIDTDITPKQSGK